jgi:hypothetical protein
LRKNRRLLSLLAVAAIAAFGLVIPATATAAPAPPEITTTSLPSVIQGTKYPATTLKVKGGSWPYKWSVVSGSLPYGLKLSSGGRLTGATGYPYSAPIPITVQVTDRKGVTAVRDFEIVVQHFTITTPSLKNGKKGGFYYVPLKTNGGCIEGQKMSWFLHEGTLPAGLKLSYYGVLSGVPKVTGTTTFSVLAQCPWFNNGSHVKEFTLTVN